MSYIHRSDAIDWQNAEFTITTAGTEQKITVIDTSIYTQLTSNSPFAVAREAGGVLSGQSTAFIIPTSTSRDVYVTATVDGQVIKAFIGLQY